MLAILAVVLLVLVVLDEHSYDVNRGYSTDAVVVLGPWHGVLVANRERD